MTLAGSGVNPSLRHSPPLVARCPVPTLSGKAAPATCNATRCHALPRRYGGFLEVLNTGSQHGAALPSSKQVRVLFVCAPMRV